MIDDHALVAESRSNAAPAIVFERLADRSDRLDNDGVVRWGRRRIIEGGARKPHQPASFGDGETVGPVITDMGSLLGRALDF